MRRLYFPHCYTCPAVVAMIAAVGVYAPAAPASAGAPLAYVPINATKANQAISLMTSAGLG